MPEPQLINREGTVMRVPLRFWNTGMVGGASPDGSCCMKIPWPFSSSCCIH